MIRTPRLPALQQRDFRLLWSGQVISTVGTHMQLFAINWHVYQLLQGRSYSFALFTWHISLNAQVLGLGTLGAIRVLPIFLFALLGGLLADRHDRRQLILWSQLLAGVCAGGLALLTFSEHVTVALLYVFTAIGVAISAFDEPAQEALFPELVPGEHLPNAATLYALLWQIGTIAGPALAGLLVGTTGLATVYIINALSFLIGVLTVALVRTRSQTPQSTQSIQAASSEPLQLNWQSIVEGLHFVWHSRLIRGTMFLDCAATFFASARTMLPFVADQLLHVGVQGYGLLATAQPIGSLGTGIFLALRKPIRHQGAIFFLSVALYGLASALFGISTSFALSAILFALTGVGDSISTVIRSTIRQQWTPAELRGRMNSIQMIIAFGGPQLGELEAGLLAALIGVPITIFSGGLITLCIVGWYAWRYPDIRAYEAK
ncbi:MAG: MFS transporter [Ktedonobacteraceae bacterium]